MAEENNNNESVDDDSSEEAADQQSVEAETTDNKDDVQATDSTSDGSDSEGSDDQVTQETSDSVSPAAGESANEPAIGNEIPVVQQTRVSAADGSEVVEPIADISMLLDIPVTLSMEIGQTRISINELLKLGKDSVIELQRMAHEPLDVLVNGTLVAHGEAVVIGDRFGIRLTDVISPQERLRKFG